MHLAHADLADCIHRFWPCETTTSTCHNSRRSGLYRFLAIALPTLHLGMFGTAVVAGKHDNDAYRARAAVTGATPRGATNKAVKAPPRSLAPAVTLSVPPGVVPDAVYRGMFRIQLPGGCLSAMVNLTRARDALRTLNSGPPGKAACFAFLLTQISQGKLLWRLQNA